MSTARIHSRCFFICAAAAACCLAGCAAPVKRIQNDPATVPQGKPQAYDDSDFAQVLTGSVRQQRVDYGGLKRDHAALDRYLGLISVVGPESTPDLFRTPSDQTCYYINAFNACALRAVLENYPTPTVYRVDTPRLEYGYFFRIDGKNVNLEQIRDKLLQAAQGDVRVEFCLCSAALGAPALSDKIYRPNTLHEQMHDAGQQAMRNPLLVRLQDGHSHLLVWKRIVNNLEQFMAYHRRQGAPGGNDPVSMLMQFADPATRQVLGQARGEVMTMPFDRRLNDLR